MPLPRGLVKALVSSLKAATLKPVMGEAHVAIVQRLLLVGFEAGCAAYLSLREVIGLKTGCRNWR